MNQQTHPQQLWNSTLRTYEFNVWEVANSTILAETIADFLSLYWQLHEVDPDDEDRIFFEHWSPFR